MNGTCKIWGTNAQIDENRYEFDFFVNSIRAGGRYLINTNEANEVAKLDIVRKAILTNWLVDQRRFGVKLPKITKNIIDDIDKIEIQSVFERMDKLVLYLNSKIKLISDFVEYDENDEKGSIVSNGLAWTSSISVKEFNELRDFCCECDWISCRNDKTGKIISIKIKPKGFSRLSELMGNNRKSDQAFVAMWFSDEMDKVYEHGLRKGIEDAGFRPFRIDQGEHNGRIDDQIIAEIRRSRFLVADFTQGKEGARGGVYCEAGFAHGLNIPVIFTCEREKIEKVHFDTRQYNHITWSTPDELRKRLANRISATIGDGPLKKAK